MSSNREYVWIKLPDNSEKKFIHLSKLDEFLSNGWIRGTFYSKERNEKLSNSLKNHVISDETRQKISARKQGSKLSSEHLKKLSDKLSGEKNPAFGTHWYNNGIKQIRIKEGDPIPDGYVKGGISKMSPEARQRLSESRKGDKNPMHNRHIEKSPETCKKLSDALKGKPKSEEAKKRLSEALTGKKRCNTIWNLGLTKESDTRVAQLAEKISQTTRGKKLSDEHRHKLKLSRCKPETQLKINNTLRLNRKICKSKLEEEAFDILKIVYGENNIIRQYSDERYPFKCDFYIKSNDLFIECNFYFTHNNHPFNASSKEDLEKVAEWLNKAQQLQTKRNLYYNAIYTWTDLDVRKLQIAQNNSLNYKIYYNLEELKHELQKETQV